jgi:hypothetical protein
MNALKVSAVLVLAGVVSLSLGIVSIYLPLEYWGDCRGYHAPSPEWDVAICQARSTDVPVEFNVSWSYAVGFNDHNTLTSNISECNGPPPSNGSEGSNCHFIFSTVVRGGSLDVWVPASKYLHVNTSEVLSISITNTDPGFGIPSVVAGVSLLGLAIAIVWMEHRSSHRGKA